MVDKDRQGIAWLSDSGRTQHLMISGWAAEPPSQGLAFYAPDFALRSVQPWLLGSECESPSVQRASLPALVTRRSPAEAAFRLGHADILQRIARGELAKVVPAVAEELEFAAPLNAAMFAAESVPGRYSYGFEFLDEGMSGLTPELLFEVDGERLKTMALAGTGRVDGPSLLEDAKEMHEHRLVVEHIVGELNALGALDVGQTVERAFGPIKHLFTPIEVRLKEPARFLDLVVRLHPTAALGGWPRAQALHWLKNDDSAKWRGRFGAPFGYVKNGFMRCVVAIRGVQWQGRKALLASGCGVVKGSVAEREWRELTLKRESTWRGLGLER
jgi:isochorismate synthase EntC